MELGKRMCKIIDLQIKTWQKKLVKKIEISCKEETLHSKIILLSNCDDFNCLP
jgi:hypothetical protein